MSKGPLLMSTSNRRVFPLLTIAEARGGVGCRLRFYRSVGGGNVSKSKERRNAMKRYESPEAVEIGNADEVIQGAEVSTFLDEINHTDFDDVEGSVVDVDE